MLSAFQASIFRLDTDPDARVIRPGWSLMPAESAKTGDGCHALVRSNKSLSMHGLGNPIQKALAIKSMRILIHGINFSPELTGIGKYSGELALWLAGQGHEVRVVTAPPYYPQWRIADGYANAWRRVKERGLWTEEHGLRTEYRGSLVVFRCPLWVPKQPSGLKRILVNMGGKYGSDPLK